MDKLLDTQFLGNTIKAYLIVLAIVIIANFLRLFLGKWLSIGLFSFFRNMPDKGHYVKIFTQKVARPLGYLFWLVVMYYAFSRLKIASKVHLFDDEYLHLKVLIFGALKTGLAISIGRILMRLTDFFGLLTKDQYVKQHGVENMLIPYVRDFIKIGIVIFTLLFVVGYIFKVDVLTLIGGLGIGGLAVALAAQDTLANLFGSLTIFLDKPFVVGDVIEVEKMEGVVENVGFRSTRIRTFDKSYLTIPNKIMASSALNNVTNSTERRVKMFLAITYTTQVNDLKKVIEEINAFLVGHEKTNESPSVHLFDFADSGFSLRVAYLVNTTVYEEYCTVREEVNFEIYAILERNKSALAYPTQVIIKSE